MPVTLLNSPKINQYVQPTFGKATDILAVIGFAIGITIETSSDIQKYRFKQTHKSGAAVCDKGFFSWSRHPNYFSEILLHFCMSTSTSTRNCELTFTSYLHDGCHACSIQLCTIRQWAVCGSLCQHTGTYLPNIAAYVCQWLDSPGASWCQEAI